MLKRLFGSSSAAYKGRTTLVAMGGPIVLAAVDWARGLPWQDTARSQVACWAVMAAMLAITLDPWLFVPVIGYIAGAGVLVVWPDAAFLVMAGCNLLAFITLLLLAARPAPTRFSIDGEEVARTMRGGIW